MGHLIKKDFKKVVVVGLGYVGLPTAALLANRGIEVIGVDTNLNVVNTINGGKIHIFEPDLDVMVRSAVFSGKLKAKTHPEPADVFIIAVPTPFCEGFKPDLSFIFEAVKNMAQVLKSGDLVILESTSPVGTTNRLAGLLVELRPDLTFPRQNRAELETDITIAYCPERILPGQVLNELVNNDRVIGGLSRHSAHIAASFYSLFVRGECFLTDARTAEMTKLTENAYRDVNIAFANELSMICERLQIDVRHLIHLANRHKRVNILKPGPGVGGHCIAVDPWFIVDSAPEESRLIKVAREVNDTKPIRVADQLQKASEEFASPTIACLGLAYKPDVNDLRESPAIRVVEELAKRKIGKLLIVEPYIERLPTSLSLFQNVCLSSYENAICNANIVAILVGHNRFREYSLDMLENKVVFDICGFLNDSCEYRSQ